MVKEISVLIPVYNVDISELVETLYIQCRRELTGFEIRCYDDGSTDTIRQLNRSIARQPEIVYRELPQNIGRSAIRNLLAGQARFNTLIFLDNDSALPDEDFIRRYIAAANDQTIISGGTMYTEKPPTEQEMLRWVYGREREQKSGAERSRNPYHSLTLNNICLPKSLALRFPLDEQLRQYGHEDTAFGWELEKHRVPLVHIDNPVIHLGLETNEVFLQKTEQAVRNLVILYHNQPDMLSGKLVETYGRLKKSGLWGVFLQSFGLIKKQVIQNLVSGKPSLFLFDLYKLYLFTQAAGKAGNKKSG